MGGENRDGAAWNLVDLLHKHSTQTFQAFHNSAVVHDSAPHVDRRTIMLQRPLDGLYRPLYPCAKAARVRQ
ncbi:hypothetical protein SmB9_26750 [Sphingosinicella microcystinivorans]|uniref:Uncharacterized protein n=1 Tax=Sphingosinicella microcystinivorans TaxID=335406 RepID=A0AAD1D6Y1_SPHMI|nr:hypothetical protein SmB9_26750 [Sphingosinicella microcystinivorans]